MRQLRFTPAARSDLEAIYDYSVAHWGTARAERYVLDIRDACAALTTGERTGAAIDDVRPGYRHLAVGSHVLFFKPSAERIEIVRILHARMDVARHL